MFATEKEMKAEAIRRMRLLGLNEECIEAFDKENQIMIAMSPFGIFANPNEKTMEEIKAFEEEVGAKVYFVVKSAMEYGLCYSYIYVSKYKEDWWYDEEGIPNNILMTYTVNRDYEECSEFGNIAVERTNFGSLVRVGQEANMSVREFTDLVIDADWTFIRVFDNESQNNVFAGFIVDLSDNILDATIDSWNIEENTICLNISFE